MVTEAQRSYVRWTAEPKFYKFLVLIRVNLSHPKPTLFLVVCYYFIGVFYLCKVLFSGFFHLTAILYESKRTQHTVTEVHWNKATDVCALWSGVYIFSKLLLAAPAVFKNSFSFSDNFIQEFKADMNFTRKYQQY